MEMVPFLNIIYKYQYQIEGFRPNYLYDIYFKKLRAAENCKRHIGMVR